MSEQREQLTSHNAVCNPPASRGLCGVGLLATRLVIGGLFLFSAAAKLGWLNVFSGGPLDILAQQAVDPSVFAGSINAFKVLHHELIPFAAFAIPWVEAFCGLALIAGLAARGAALLINLLLIAFILAMYSVIVRDMSVDCSCFGKFLGGEVGWLSIGRNVVLMAIAAPVARWGGGMLALDNLIANPRHSHAGG